MFRKRFGFWFDIIFIPFNLSNVSFFFFHLSILGIMISCTKEHITSPVSVIARASPSGAEGHGVDHGPHHTKDVQKGTNG